MTPARSPDALRGLRRAAPVLAALMLAAPSLATAAGEATRHRTEMTVRFGGLSVGTARFDYSLTGNAYEVALSGGTAGVASLLAPGKGSATSRGALTTAGPAPAAHHAESLQKKKRATLDMTFGRAGVEDVRVDPDKRKKKVAPKYVPIGPEHLLGVIDPASSILVPPATVLDQACARAMPVYDGDTRFDMVLAPKRVDRVETEGYAGPAFVCTLRYRPVAGHQVKARNVRMMADNKDMEIWLAPMGAGGWLSPIRIEVPTRIGRFSAVATRFGPL